MMSIYRADLHVHTSASADGRSSLEEIARAAGETGIRADIAGTVFAFDGDIRPELDPVLALMDRYRDDPMVSIRIGPHSPYICSPAVLRSLVEAARSAAVPYGDFFRNAPRPNPNRALIRGVVCGVRVEAVEHPVLRDIRCLDKLIDELAKGRPMEKILRK